MTMIFSGHPVEDMETAKRMIANHPNVDLPDLIAIASDRTQPRSARIAAIYTLGFTDDHGISGAALAHIASNTEEPDDVRDHATEALDSIQSPH